MEAFKKFTERMKIEDPSVEQGYLKAKQMRYSPLMELMVRFNGAPYENFYDFLGKEMKALNMVFTAPKKWGEWHFNDPVKELRVLPNGLGSIQVMEGEINPQRWLLEKPAFQKAMVRFIVERAYPEGSYGLLTPEKFFQLVHRGVVPFVIRIVAYTKQRRYKIDINLAKNEVMADFRWGKIPPRVFRERDVKEYIVFDKIYASLPVAHFPKMFFEAIFESNGLDEELLRLIFNVSTPIIRNNVGVLIKNKVVEFNESSGLYTVRLPMLSP